MICWENYGMRSGEGGFHFQTTKWSTVARWDIRQAYRALFLRMNIQRQVEVLLKTSPQDAQIGRNLGGPGTGEQKLSSSSPLARNAQGSKRRGCGESRLPLCWAEECPGTLGQRTCGPLHAIMSCHHHWSLCSSIHHVNNIDPFFTSHSLSLYPLIRVTLSASLPTSQLFSGLVQAFHFLHLGIESVLPVFHFPVVTTTGQHPAW